MPRTCTCEHLPPAGESWSKEYCVQCWLYHTNPRYREAVDKEPHNPSPPVSTSPTISPQQVLTNIIQARHPCKHLGGYTGEIRECPTCPGNREQSNRIKLRLRGCAIHDQCTEGKPLPGVACCLICKNYTAPERVQVRVTADGIGDALLGLTAVAGVKRDHPEDVVIYSVKHTHQEIWAKLFEGYDQLITSVQGEVTTYSPHDTYPQQNMERLARPRWQHYAEACHTKATLPWPKPIPPTDLEWAKRFRDCVVLAPFSGWPRPGNPLWMSNNRVWLPSHWLLLERLLHEQGRQCVILDGITGDKERTHAYRSVVLRDEPAPRIAALMAVASCVVGCDSGMTHLAGMLRTPTVALCGAIKGEGVYGIYPTVKVMNGPLSCSGCHYQGKHGWHPICDGFCASLQSIQPSEVLEIISLQDRVPYSRGFLKDPALDRTIGSQIDTLRHPYADRRHTFSAFLEALRGLHGQGNPSPLVLETGCQRGDDDYGAGMSTTLLGRFLKYHNQGEGKLISVDNCKQNVEFARSRSKGLPVEIVESDSRSYLTSYSGPPLDGVYLDSVDSWIPGFQEACLEEAIAVLPHLAPHAMILIDDTWPEGPREQCGPWKEGDKWGGKGAKSVPMFIENGWEVKAQGYQTLLGRKA